MQFAFFYPKDIQKIFQKTSDFVENLEMTQIARDGGSCSLRHFDAIVILPFYNRMTSLKS